MDLNPRPVTRAEFEEFCEEVDKLREDILDLVRQLRAMGKLRPVVVDGSGEDQDEPQRPSI